ncbi:aldo/keto reductase [Roseovarius sp. C7]|uniref:aldo/keto reductase n=1 Tax=Roseovarius sp. C7 TaxID=3398643 RepID=UPI0039F6A621
MQRRELGRTGIEVSALCLGTMTFGRQTPAKEGHAQLDRALAAGIDFVDTAEMYPVNPVHPEDTGVTESIVGDWIAASGKRQKIVLATKHSGAGFAGARDGAAISSQTIPQAIEGSLRRLKTDVIDLYQFHWPNRGSYMFRQNWGYAPWEQDREATRAHMEDALGALGREVERGTIRAFGLSNESTWGTAEWLRIAKETKGPRVASIQNEYSLLCRMADTDLAEMMVNEGVSLLPFSPLGAGFLTGKYQGGAVPEGSRMSVNETMGGRRSERVFAAVEAYVSLAQKHGLDPVHMALAWTVQRPFVASSIFGATRLEQLDHIIEGMELTLSDEVLTELDEVHRQHPMPY